MKLKHAYLILCVLGLLLPYWQFIPWALEHGINIPLFVHDLFETRIGGFFGFDVLVSAIVLCVFVFAEAGRLRMRSRWWPILAVLFVGVSWPCRCFSICARSSLSVRRPNQTMLWLRASEVMTPTLTRTVAHLFLVRAI